MSTGQKSLKKKMILYISKSLTLKFILKIEGLGFSALNLSRTAGHLCGDDSWS